MSQTNFFEDMPVQKVDNFLVITYLAMEGIDAILDKKSKK